MVPSSQAATMVTSVKGSIIYTAGKTKLVALFVSNCKVGNQRMLKFYAA